MKEERWLARGRSREVSARSDRQISTGSACNVSVAVRIHRDPRRLSHVVSHYPGVTQGAAAGVQSQHEHAGYGGVGGPLRSREIRGGRGPRHVGVAQSIHRDAVGLLVVRAADISRIQDVLPGGIQLGDKRLGGKTRAGVHPFVGRDGKRAQTAGTEASPGCAAVGGLVNAALRRGVEGVRNHGIGG